MITITIIIMIITTIIIRLRGPADGPPGRGPSCARVPASRSFADGLEFGPHRAQLGGAERATIHEAWSTVQRAQLASSSAFPSATAVRHVRPAQCMSN